MLTLEANWLVSSNLENLYQKRNLQVSELKNDFNVDFFVEFWKRTDQKTRKGESIQKKLI